MKYRLIAMTGLGLLTAACGNGNIYPMAPDQVYEKLVSAPIKPSGKGPFGKLDVHAGGDGSSTVRWGTSYGPPLCEANIAPEGADKSKIMVYCGAGGEGAAAGMYQEMKRKAIIEHIDATLTGREYDFKRARGTTASSWPDDPRQADGSIGAAAGEALRMEQDMRRDLRDMERDQEARKAERERRQRVNFTPGEPMIDPSGSR